MKSKSYALCLLSFVIPFALPAQTLAPPNAPADISFRGQILTIQYNSGVLLTATVNIDSKDFSHRVNVQRDGDALQQTILLTTNDWSKKIRLSGTISTSEEGFPCEVDRPGRGSLLVRHSSGIGKNLRNRAVYDRMFDWVLSVDANPLAVVAPAVITDRGHAFSVDVEGFEIVLRFRPRFYQQHRGLKYFEPWTYKPWPSSVAGWISWFAFFSKVTEHDMMETADVFSEVLGPFGYEYFQMDDGYQRKNSTPEFWLTPKETFPSGLKFLADYIKSKGLKPGIWTATNFHDSAYVASHPSLFVQGPEGKPAYGNWVQYIPDGANETALETLVKPLYGGLRKQGWEYFKVDALRHLRYEGYNANRSYYDSKNLDRVEVYRRFVKTIREEIGRDHFMLGCWGIRPELVGFLDGCRIGDDGFAYAGLSQYNSFNNVVWRNDPDHIELNEDAYRSTMVTSLTGSLMMLTDKPAVYRTPVVTAAKKTAPVLFTLPGQLYDADPSRSGQLAQVETEVSGSGPRVFDAGYTPSCFLYALEVHRSFESWLVLGRTGGDFLEIAFSDLGLDSAKEYCVFEFWTGRFWGIFKNSFTPGHIDDHYRSQAFVIRERTASPQILSTSRHISSGGVDLTDVRWSKPALVGSSVVVAGDPYTLAFTEPAGTRLASFECGLLPSPTIRRENDAVFITLHPRQSGAISWKAKYDLP